MPAANSSPMPSAEATRHNNSRPAALMAGPKGTLNGMPTIKRPLPSAASA